MTSWINVVAAVAGATVQTAPPPAPPSDPIIVEGEKVQSEQALSELARDIAGNPRPRRPLARFERPLCLMVAAADTALGQQVAERIIENARDARVPVRGKGCKPNALLALSDNAQAQLRDVKASGRRLFAGLSAREIDAALGARDPVYVFQASRRRQTPESRSSIVRRPPGRTACPDRRTRSGAPGGSNAICARICSPRW